jgi:peptidoglycan/LPS O-acetylase OafA/YrhL
MITSNEAFNYFLSNSIAVWNIHVIPGVYDAHRTNSLNGSLWSITLEVRLYLFLAVMYVSGFFAKSREYRVAVFVILVISIAVYPSYVPMIGDDALSYGNYSFPVFSCVFLIGGIFYLLEDKIKVGLPIVIVFLVAVLIFKGSLFYKGAIFSLAIVFSIWLGTSGFAKRRLQLKNDYSYGMYLYGWPAQQIAYSLLNNVVHMKPWIITITAIPIAFLFSYVSWRIIESPCMKVGSKKIKKATIDNGLVG